MTQEPWEVVDERDRLLKLLRRVAEWVENPESFLERNGKTVSYIGHNSPLMQDIHKALGEQAVTK